MNQNSFLYVARFLTKNSFLRKIKNLYVNRTRHWYRDHIELFRDKNGVEIGGPSPIFRKAGTGAIPTYGDANSIDNVNWSGETFWSKHKNGYEFAPYGTAVLGKEWVIDSTKFTAEFSEKYDFLQCSHVLEHIAGTVKALLSWRSVLKAGGAAVILVPDKRRTYDVNRPYTTLQHFIDDFENDIGEEDETHFEEIIKLHSLSNDTSDTSNIKSMADWEERVRDNVNSRIIHQHVFKMETLSELLALCGYRVIVAERWLPHHIGLVAVKTGDEPLILSNTMREI